MKKFDQHLRKKTPLEIKKVDHNLFKNHLDKAAISVLSKGLNKAIAQSRIKKQKIS